MCVCAVCRVQCFFAVPFTTCCALCCVCVLCAPRPRQPQNHPKAKEQQANHKDISQQRQATPKDIHRKKKSSGAEDTSSGGQRKPCPRPSELEQMCAVCRAVLLCYALYYVLCAVLLRWCVCPRPSHPPKPETFTTFLDAVLLCCYAVPCALGTSSRRSSRSTSNKRSSRSISSWSSRSTSSRRSNRSTSSRRSNRSTNSRRSSRSRSSSSRSQHEQEQQQVLLGIARVLF